MRVRRLKFRVNSQHPTVIFRRPMLLSNVMRFLMLCHISNITFQSIFSTSIHILILSSNHPKCPTSMKLTSSYCFHFGLKISSHKLQYFRNDKYFFGHNFMRCGQLAYYLSMPPQYCHASYNDLFSHSCPKVSTNLSNLALHASLSNVVNPNFIISLSN